MTNGEKLCYIFPKMHYTLSEKQPRRVVTTIGVCASFDLDWWNAEYKEPNSDIRLNRVENELNQDKNELESTAKNDLAVEECISRKAALDACHNFAIGVLDDYYEKCLKQWIIDLPSVTPIRPKGHWIGNYQVDFGEWQEYDVKLSDGFVTDNCHCSECGEELLSGDRGMFCPYCGADMREVE